MASPNMLLGTLVRPGGWLCSLQFYSLLGISGSLRRPGHQGHCDVQATGVIATSRPQPVLHACFCAEQGDAAAMSISSAVAHGYKLMCCRPCGALELAHGYRMLCYPVGRLGLRVGIDGCFVNPVGRLGLQARAQTIRTRTCEATSRRTRWPWTTTLASPVRVRVHQQCPQHSAKLPVCLLPSKPFVDVVRPAKQLTQRSPRQAWSRRSRGRTTRTPSAWRAATSCTPSPLRATTCERGGRHVRGKHAHSGLFAGPHASSRAQRRCAAPLAAAWTRVFWVCRPGAISPVPGQALNPQGCDAHG